ncbi:MAG: hypothetical protein JRE47_13180 [Deltaproteobacteria bacterium]|nr:hypothetical protein [Deltaproteobacteria bacterium]
MAANTGRTNKKWTTFNIDDSGGTLRQIKVSSINGVGLTYDAADVTAFSDAIKNALPGHANCIINISGPIDTTADTGNHVVLSGVNGGVTPLSLDVKIGIRQSWDAEPQFGMTSSATSGFLVRDYIVNPDDSTFSAVCYVMGPTAPAWGVAAET